ncbi:duf895 domain membrane protein [Colletotrichum graminicola]|nr:duf895 domain membrane protein [Colletotrichum graminicola]
MHRAVCCPAPFPAGKRSFDGTAPASRLSSASSDSAELRELGRLMLRKEFLLVPFFIHVNWILPHSSSHLSLYFFRPLPRLGVARLRIGADHKHRGTGGRFWNGSVSR